MQMLKVKIMFNILMYHHEAIWCDVLLWHHVKANFLLASIFVPLISFSHELALERVGCIKFIFTYAIPMVKHILCVIIYGSLMNASLTQYSQSSRNESSLMSLEDVQSSIFAEVEHLCQKIQMLVSWERWWSGSCDRFISWFHVNEQLSSWAIPAWPWSVVLWSITRFPLNSRESDWTLEGCNVAGREIRLTKDTTH